MRTLNIPLEDKRFEELEKKKGKRTWQEFIDDIISDKWEEKDG